MENCIKLPGLDPICFGRLMSQVGDIEFGMTSAGILVMALVAICVAAFIIIDPAR